jgi:hypothetical protein
VFSTQKKKKKKDTLQSLTEKKFHCPFVLIIYGASQARPNGGENNNSGLL